MKTLADDISPNIKVTYDIPSNNQDNKVPILDLKAGINSDGKIEYIFFKKSVASNLVTLRSAAFPKKQKLTNLTQQCFTRLHNTSEKADDEVKISILNDFMYELKSSGYSETERLTILEGGINTYKNLKLKELQGLRPFYRPNEFQREIRKKAKDRKKTDWFKGKNGDDKYKSVMFVDATPGDKLLKMVRDTEDKYKIAEDKRIKVVSKAGPKLMNLLERNNPFNKNCDDKDCPPCSTLDPSDKKPSKCRVNNVSYEGKCKTCALQGKCRSYTGETSRNLHVRSKEHVKDLLSGNKNSWMSKHINLEHGGNKEGVEFTWKVLKVHPKPLQRQLHEAVVIKNKKDEDSLNSKSEFNSQRIKRISLDKNMANLNCDICGSKCNTIEEKIAHTAKFHKRYKCQKCEYLSFGTSGLDEHVLVKHNVQD